jgi:hypothetical protein
MFGIWNGDDNYDVEHLHESDPATRRDIHVEVDSRLHVVITMPEEFLVLFFVFFPTFVHICFVSIRSV